MTVEELKKYKDGLYSSLSRELDAFEKNFILISSGILAFSITFIKEIVKIDDAVWLTGLFIGWGLILSAIGLMMYAFLSSVDASNELWKKVDDYIISEGLYNATIELRDSQALHIKTETRKILFSRKRKLKGIRYAAIFIFLIGVGFFSSFVGYNLYLENHKDKTIKILNKQKCSISIEVGKTDTTSRDSVIVIKN